MLIRQGYGTLKCEVSQKWSGLYYKRKLKRAVYLVQDSTRSLSRLFLHNVLHHSGVSINVIDSPIHPSN